MFVSDVQIAGFVFLPHLPPQLSPRQRIRYQQFRYPSHFCCLPLLPLTGHHCPLHAQTQPPILALARVLPSTVYVAFHDSSALVLRRYQGRGFAVVRDLTLPSSMLSLPLLALDLSIAAEVLPEFIT